MVLVMWCRDLLFGVLDVFSEYGSTTLLQSFLHLAGGLVVEFECLLHHARVIERQEGVAVNFAGGHLMLEEGQVMLVTPHHHEGDWVEMDAPWPGPCLEVNTVWH